LAVCIPFDRFLVALVDLVSLILSANRAAAGQSSSIESNQNSISWILVYVYVLFDAPRGNRGQQFKHVLFDLIKIAFLWFM
jgi:hypothetical protein